MSALPDCPDCGRPLARDRIGVGACYRCSIRVPLVQCEDCEERYREDEVAFGPGATAWCPDCRDTSPEPWA